MVLVSGREVRQDDNQRRPSARQLTDLNGHSFLGSSRGALNLRLWVAAPMAKAALVETKTAFGRQEFGCTSLSDRPDPNGAPLRPLRTNTLHVRGVAHANKRTCVKAAVALYTIYKFRGAPRPR